MTSYNLAAAIDSKTAELTSNIHVDTCPMKWLAVALAIIVGLVLFTLNSLKGGTTNFSVSRGQLAVISILFGLVMGIACAYFGAHDITQDIIAGVVCAVFVVQVGEIIRHESSAERVVSLERALRYPVLFDRVTFQLDQYESLLAMLQMNPKLSRFGNEVISLWYAELNQRLETLTKGRVVIDQVHRELTSNKEFLLTLPDHSVRAVSYEDETFWDEPAGRDFLEAHKSVISKGRTVRRIFILNSQTYMSQVGVVRYQARIGISCAIVLEENIQPQFRRDFVLYDEKYVRYAETVIHGTENVLKKATLSSIDVEVRDFAEKFAFLDAQSRPPEVIFADAWNQEDVQ